MLREASSPGSVLDPGGEGPTGPLGSLALLVVGPTPARLTAAAALAERLGGVVATSLDEVRAGSVLLVAPRSHGARGLVRGPVVGGRPVGIVQLDHLDDLAARSLSPDPAAPWVVAAMAKNVFLDATEHWATRLAAGHRTVDLRADRARRTDLVDALRAGPGVVLYAGHGSPRGWAGYQSLRIGHLDPADGAARRPAGLVMAFACQTLARPRGRWPFGAELVERGLVRSYLAPATSVFTADAEELADLVVDLLAQRRERTVAQLMIEVERAVVDRPAARRAWATFRLVGDPTTGITG